MNGLLVVAWLVFNLQGNGGLVSIPYDSMEKCEWVQKNMEYSAAICIPGNAYKGEQK